MKWVQEELTSAERSPRACEPLSFVDMDNRKGGQTLRIACSISTRCLSTVGSVRFMPHLWMATLWLQSSYAATNSLCATQTLFRPEMCHGSWATKVSGVRQILE
eukprot:1256454-Amphidinium_carterae.1